MIYYYINLDRVPERASFIEKQFKALKLHSQLRRLSATDALTMPPHPGYKPRQWGPRWEMTQSEVACFISHRRCWEMMLEDGSEYAVILEDDVFVSKDLDVAVAEIISHAPKGFDVVKLDGVPQMCRYGVAEPIKNARQLREILQVAASASCYLVSRRGAERLFSGSTSFCDNLDDYVFNPAFGRKLMQLEPAVAVQAIWSELPDTEVIGEQVKTSERTQDRKINFRKSKGPALYRLFKEIKRTARKLSRKLYRDRVLLASGGLIGKPRLASDLGKYKSAP